MATEPRRTTEEEVYQTTEGEIVCEDGFQWHPDKQLCLHTKARCPKGMFLSIQRNMCLPKNGDALNCPSGYEYRDDVNGCEGKSTWFY